MGFPDQDQTCVPWITRQILYHWTTKKSSICGCIFKPPHWIFKLLPVSPHWKLPPWYPWQWCFVHMLDSYLRNKCLVVWSCWVRFGVLLGYISFHSGCNVSECFFFHIHIHRGLYDFLLLIWYKELFFSFAFLGLVIRLCIWGSMTGWLFRVLTVRIIFLLVRNILTQFCLHETFHIIDHLLRLYDLLSLFPGNLPAIKVKTWFGLQSGPSSHLLAESES